VFSCLISLLIFCSLSVTIESTIPHCRERATSVPAVVTNRQAPPCTFTPQFSIQLRAHRPTLARGLTHAAAYRTESEAGSPEWLHFAAKPNASIRLSGPCDAERRDAAREGIRYHANSRACVVVRSAVLLLLCVNKHADDECPSGSQQTQCETLPKTNFKGRTLKYSKAKSVIWNKTPYVNLNTE